MIISYSPLWDADAMLGTKIWLMVLDEGFSPFEAYQALWSVQVW